MKPPSLIAVLEQALPGFAVYVRSDSNLFDRDDVHGVFAACAHFVREHPVAAGSWKALASLLNDAVGGADQELDQAACTCFLESLAAPDHPLRALLRDRALDYWNQWE